MQMGASPHALLRRRLDRIMQVYVKVLIFTALVALSLGSPTAKKPGYGPGEQDWGWFDVRKGAHMFYWLFYTTAKVNSPSDRPLVIWLQGGPGGSSTGYGNFAEIGPLHVNGSARQYAWTKELNVLFIDNPVGTGFSYVDNLMYLTKDNIQIGSDMTVFLTEFYNKFPVFRKTPTYIFSESYGGKMAVEIGKQLDGVIKSGKLDMNLKGIALVDSWICPIDSVNGWSPLLLNTGLIDERSHRRLTAGANNVQKAIDNGQWERATDLWGQLEMDIIRETNGIDFYNILTKVEAGRSEPESTPMKQLFKTHVRFNEDNEIGKIMNGAVRAALKIPSNIVYGGQRNAVFNALRGDFMKPVMNVVTHLLEKTNIQVIVISGQLDLIVDTYGTLHWVDNLKWKGSSEWASAKRIPFVLNGIIEGYVTKAGGLSFYWVNRAGHMVPKDNPETSMAILKAVTKFS